MALSAAGRARRRQRADRAEDGDPTVPDKRPAPISVSLDPSVKIPGKGMVDRAAGFKARDRYAAINDQREGLLAPMASPCRNRYSPQAAVATWVAPATSKLVWAFGAMNPVRLACAGQSAVGTGCRRRNQLGRWPRTGTAVESKPGLDSGEIKGDALSYDPRRLVDVLSAFRKSCQNVNERDPAVKLPHPVIDPGALAFSPKDVPVELSYILLGGWALPYAPANSSD